MEGVANGGGIKWGSEKIEGVTNGGVANRGANGGVTNGGSGANADIACLYCQ